MRFVGQDIASVYYDIKDFKKGEVRTGLLRAEERLRRRQAMKSSSGDNKKRIMN